MQGTPWSRFAPKSVLASVLLLAGCGPVAIGAAVGSAGGGGGAAGPASPTLARLDPAFQPDADRTVVGVRIAQSSSRQVRLRLEYDLGQGRVPVPAANLLPYDPAGRRPAPLLPLDAAQNFLVTPSSGGTAVYLSWDHRADLGQVERRNVTLFAVFTDALLSQADFASDAANSVQLLANATVGRELGQLSDLVLRRQSTDPESAFVVDAVLQDRGGDREATGFSFEYAVTSAVPQESDFVVLPPAIPTAVTDTEQPDGSVRSTLSFGFDPLQLGVPFGDYTNFWIRVQARETYPQNRSDLPASVLVGPQNLLQLAATSVGFAPRIEGARVVNPGSAQSNAGDPGKPWLRLPISVSITNPSPTRAMRVRLQGRYEIDNTTFPCTPVLDGDPQTDAEFDLAPLERRRQFVVWNVAFDEGLGNRLVNDPPYSTPRLCQVSVEAVRIASPGSALAGAPLRASASAGPTQLSTNPFVDFRENLLADVGRTWSAGDEQTQATRDLFFTRFPTSGGGAQETTLGLDQQFEPLQITPPPPVFDFLAATPPVNNGVYDLVPTDFDPDAPDCLVWIDGSFRYVRWPNSAGAVVEQLGPVGAALGRRGRDPITFTIGSGSAQQKVAVFHTWDEQVSGGNKTVQVRLTAVARNSLGGFAITTGPVDTFFLNGTPAVNISAVGGDFDGDPATHELVLGTSGTERATAPLPGLLHRWTFSLSGAQLVISAPAPLATMPPATGDATRNISAWLMTGWRDEAGSRDGLVVVRQLDGTPTLNRELDVWVLRQNAGGGLQTSWSLLTSELSARPVGQGGFPELGITSLRRVFAEDLDGNVDGIGGSDLLLVFERRESATNQVFADVWLYARRAARPAQWRRIVKDLVVLDPVTLQPYSQFGGQVDAEAFQLVDVNGDRLLDLLTAERRLLPPVPPAQPQPARDAHCNYLASSLSGVAGKLRNLGAEAGLPERRSVLPGLLDADGDGNTDVVTGGLLLLGSPDGTYTQARSLVAGPLARHRVERLFLDAPADSMEVIVGDESINAQNRVYRLGGMGAGVTSLSVTTLFDYSLGGSGDLREVRTLTAPDTGARRVKDLVGLVGGPATSSLRRGRVEGGTTLLSASMWSGQVATAAGLALVRRSAIPLGSTAGTEAEVQDVVVADAQNPGRVVIFESHNAYQPRTFDFAGENVVRIAEGSIGSDSLEDLCVLTEQNGIYRVRCLQQSADPSFGIGQPAAQLELARFQRPFASSAIRSLQFDRGARAFAQGFLLVDDDQGGSLRSEVRLLRPIGDSAGLALRMVRSPLDQPVDLPIEAVVADRDKDQLIEVTGGQRAVTQGLQTLQTNIAPQ
jgi:hypothetical protein